LAGDCHTIALKTNSKEAVMNPKEHSSLSKHYRFWLKARPILQRKTGEYNRTVSPRVRHYLEGKIFYKGIELTSVILKDGARTELYIRTQDRSLNEKIFQGLEDKKRIIEKRFEGKLEWWDRNNITLKPFSIFARCSEHAGLHDEDHWEDIIALMAENFSKLLHAIKEPLEIEIKKHT
jgi:hypothetical protein